MAVFLPFLFTLLAAHAEPGGKGKHDVYLLIGQSNMAGRAKMETGSAEAIPKVFLLNGEGQWEAAIHPLNRYSTIRKGLGMQKVGPGGSFAKSMSKAYPDHSIGLVVNAKEGPESTNGRRVANSTMTRFVGRSRLRNPAHCVVSCGIRVRATPGSQRAIWRNWSN